MQPMAALADRKPGDAEQLQRVRDYNKALEAETARRMGDHFAGARRVIERARNFRYIRPRALARVWKTGSC